MTTWQLWEVGNPLPRKDACCRLFHMIPVSSSRRVTTTFISLGAVGVFHSAPVPKAAQGGYCWPSLLHEPSMNGVRAPYMPSLPFWDLGICLATGKPACFHTDQRQTCHRGEPLNSHMTPPDETKLHLREHKAHSFYK